MNEPRMADSATTSQATPSRIPVRSISLAIVVTVVLYVGMATLADWEAFFAAVSALPGLLWAQVVALSLLSYLLRFARWHHFIFALGHTVPIVRNLEIYLAAFALTLTPAKAGETIRSVYLHPYGVSYPHSIGAFVSERLFDLVSVGALASLATSMLPEQRRWIVATIACILMVVILFRNRLLIPIGTRLTRGTIFYAATATITTIRFLTSGRQVVVSAPLSLIAWMAQGASLYLIVQALGYQLPASTVIAIYCLSILVGTASFSPSGLGTAEAAIAILLSAAGIDHTDAIVASLSSRSLTLWLAVGIGALAMIKTARCHKMKKSSKRRSLQYHIESD